MVFRVTGVLSALAGAFFLVFPASSGFSEPLPSAMGSDLAVRAGSAISEAAGEVLRDEGSGAGIPDHVKNVYGSFLLSREAGARLRVAETGEAGHAASSRSIISLQGNTISVADMTDPDLSPALDVKPRFLDLVPPLPHVRGQVPHGSSSAAGNGAPPARGQIISASIMVIGPVVLPEPDVQAPLSVPLVAPVPAPRSARPILPVFPASVSMMRSVQDVSGDPLVHVDAPGSWPRRLDQINALALRGQMAGGGQAGHSDYVSSYQQLPEGYVLVGASASP